MIVETILLILLNIVVIIKYQTVLQIFQQNRYEVRRYHIWIKDNLKKNRYLYSLLGFYIFLIIIIALLPQPWQQYIYIAILIVWLWRLYLRQKHHVDIIPLKLTHRVWRQIAVTILLLLLLNITVVWQKVPGVYLLIILPFLPWLLMLITAWLTAPIEYFMRQIFINKAKQILDNNPNLIKIGITGSYGKTSSKNMVQEIISAKYYSLMTPASFNTPLGITITIRNQLKSIHQVFVCEMGADKVHEIRNLAKFVKPQYGLVTSIGYQHLATFKSIENIITEKMSLIESLPADGVGFLNKDNEFIRHYSIKNRCKIVWFGIDEADVDYRAINVIYTIDGCEFDVVTKNQEQYHFKSRLLGEHNVANLLAAIAIGRELGIDWSQLQQSVRQIKYIRHRLELKKINGITFIDNAFNSNPVGAKMSLDVLQRMSNKRYIITPGLIDLGPIEDQENKAFGNYMLNRVDVVVLVGRKQTKKILEGLQEVGFNQDGIVIVDTVNEAFNYVFQHATVNDVVLIENDLPDAFNQ